jgi:hypothetical protein
MNEDPTREELVEKLELINEHYGVNLFFDIQQPGGKEKYRVQYYPYENETSQSHLSPRLEGGDMWLYLSGLDDGLSADRDQLDKQPR